MAFEGELFDRAYYVTIKQKLNPVTWRGGGHSGRPNQATYTITSEDSKPENRLHVSFSFQKGNVSSLNTGKLSIWNLSKEHLAVLSSEDCYIEVGAGYKNSHVNPIFSGSVVEAKTDLDGADMKTDIQVIDDLPEFRDRTISAAFDGKIGWKEIINLSIGRQAAIVYSDALKRVEFPKTTTGFSFVGTVQELLDKAADACGIRWCVQNGIVHISREGEAMHNSVYVLEKRTGLIGIPSQVNLTQGNMLQRSTYKMYGWAVKYLMNSAIGIGDTVRLVSNRARGDFIVHELSIKGDNYGGDWTCDATLVEEEKKVTAAESNGFTHGSGKF